MTHCTDIGTSHCVLASFRCTAVIAEARTARVGYPDGNASCIRTVTDNKKEPQEWTNGIVLERADKNTWVVHCAVVAQKLYKGAPNSNCQTALNVFGWAYARVQEGGT